MRDAYNVLKQKEEEIARVRHEIESLKIVASLLLEDIVSDQSDKPELVAATKPDGLRPDLETIGNDQLFSSMVDPAPTSFWNILKR